MKNVTCLKDLFYCAIKFKFHSHLKLNDKMVRKNDGRHGKKLQKLIFNIYEDSNIGNFSYVFNNVIIVVFQIIILLIVL